MNYDAIVEECKRRMMWANEILAANPELSGIVWKENYDRMCAAFKAKQQASGINYTSCGSADIDNRFK